MFDDDEEDLEQETQAATDLRRQPPPPPLLWTGKTPGHKPYTPQFSPLATVTVRRLAWALRVSMPKAVDRAVNILPSIFPPSLVCPVCKDNTKCNLCAFNQANIAESTAQAL
jgi:hypothetical protein